MTKKARPNQQERLIKIFEDCGAILHGHFVYTSGRHGEVYVNKDAIYPHPSIHNLCNELVELMQSSAVADCLGDVEAIVAPAYGGIVLSRLVADCLMGLEFVDQEVMAVYAEKDGDRFVIRRGYDKLIAGKQVLVVDDIMTTGGSVKKVIEVARICGAKVEDVAVLWNRGGIKAKDLGVDCLVSLVEKQFESWSEADCPLCKSGVPVNKDVGKGGEFLIRKAQEDVVKAANMAAQSLYERSVTSIPEVRTKEQASAVIQALIQQAEKGEKK